MKRIIQIKDILTSNSAVPQCFPYTAVVIQAPNLTQVTHITVITRLGDSRCRSPPPIPSFTPTRPPGSVSRKCYLFQFIL